MAEADGIDLLDCFRCVSVCPTGIDIRNGTQLECIGCANCIDACDEVMAKVGQEPGLVRYDSLAGFQGQKRRRFRPRTALYGFLLLVGLTVFLVLASGRQAFEARLLRGNGPPYSVREGTVTNLYSLHLINKGGKSEVLEIRSQDRNAIEVVIPVPEVDLASFGDRRVPIIARVASDRFEPGMILTLAVESGGERLILGAPFLGPK